MLGAKLNRTVIVRDCTVILMFAEVSRRTATVRRGCGGFEFYVAGERRNRIVEVAFADIRVADCIVRLRIVWGEGKQFAAACDSCVIPALLIKKGLCRIMDVTRSEFAGGMGADTPTI